MAPIPKITQYFKLARDYKASDILLCAGSVPALKIRGDIHFLQGAPALTGDNTEEYLLQIVNDAQKERFEATMDLDFSYHDSEFGRYRVNAFLNKDGVGIIFRPISETVPEIETLGLPKIVSEFPHYKNGLVVVTGTVGSGKSTTLASVMQVINRSEQKHIITIEDPIEFVFRNDKSIINQREVYDNTQNFHMALRASLREAPDVLLVGEMRDPETVSLAVEAAETGILVFATLHTSGAAKAVDRMIDMFDSAQQNQIRSSLSVSLRAVVWQELLKTKDGQGRVPACEVLVGNSEVASMIRKNVTHQIPSAMETGMADGMVTMDQSMERLKAEGRI